MSQEITIALDAMGGDYAPSEIVKGAVLASSLESEINIMLVGQEEVLRDELSKLGDNFANIQIKHASDVVDMNDSASWSVRRKSNSSIAVCAKLVKEKHADALVSAGNTGAVTSAVLIILGRLPGVSRPAIGITVPSEKKPVFILDAGATVDCKPKNLMQFAKMARIYTERVMDADNPSIGLLSVGEEEGKGNKLTQESFKLLERVNLNFMGNVEGGDIPSGKTDIVVCDGFTGNVVLKLMEGVAGLLFNEIKKVMQTSFATKTAGAILRPNLMELKKSLDYEEYGGAPLLGVDGVCIICHGSSQEKAIGNAVKVAAKTVRERVVEEIKEEIAKEEED